MPVGKLPIVAGSVVSRSGNLSNNRSSMRPSKARLSARSMRRLFHHPNISRSTSGRDHSKQKGN